MKYLKQAIFLAILALIHLSLPAQPPMGMNYQAVLRHDDGQVMVSEQVDISFEILQGSNDGQVVFSETHNTTTNAFGLVNLVIGSLQTLEGIDWGADTYFLRVSVDGDVMGTSQLLSVPFALHALSSDDVFSGDYEDLQNKPDLSSFVSIENPQEGELVFFDGQQWQRIAAGMEGQILGLINGVPQWIDLPGDDNGEDPPTTVTDIDGNVYSTVIAGEQEWMAENLKTTRFNNGTQIAYPGDNFPDWINNTTGAYAWYNNDEATYKDTYGALYNFPAVNNGNLCPIGWRVPSVDDWNTLITYLTGTFEDVTTTNVGNALKSCRQVNSPLGGDCNTTGHPRWNEHETHYGTDLVGFSAMPGGNRLLTNEYDKLGMTGYYWTSTPAASDRAWQRYTHYNNSGFYSSHTWVVNGNSVRCMRDVDLDPPSEYSLNLQVSPANGGVVTGAGDYAPGAAVPLTATANEDFDFVSWTTQFGVLISNVANFTYTMPPQNITLIANFQGEGNGFGTVTDIDGNEYLTITVGTLEWMAGNLRTTKYSNGNNIDYPGTNQAAWQTNTTGAYAWFNNDINNKEIYGGLYNWHAVNTGNLCPAGWRVPSESDWNNLSTYLINNNSHLNTENVGNALKSCRQIDSPLGGECNTTVHPRWDSHTTHYGTDEFSFGGFPGGRRDTSGVYDFLGLLGYHWTSNQASATEAHYRSLSRANGRLSAISQEKQFGFSVRCVKDVE